MTAGLIQHRVHHLTILEAALGPTDSPSACKGNPCTLVLGNAYGILPYQTHLVDRLGERGVRAYTFAFSGQDDTNDRFYSQETCTDDIGVAIEFLLSRHEKVSVLSHCAGGLMLLSRLSRYPCRDVDKLLIYGLLYFPQRRRHRATRLFQESGVRVGLTEADWRFDAVSAIRSIGQPVLFCHPHDPLNVGRASDKEMTTLLRATRQGRLVCTGRGYDEEPERVNDYLPFYLDWLERGNNARKGLLAD